MNLKMFPGVFCRSSVFQNEAVSSACIDPAVSAQAKLLYVVSVTLRGAPG